MIVREFREAWRRLGRRPGYAGLSIMVLGVGLGVVVFLFSLINTLILAPLPYPHPDRLMAIGDIQHSHGGVGDSGIGIDDIDGERYLRLKDGLPALERVGVYVPAGFVLDVGQATTRQEGGRFTASMLDLLGVRPLLGRGFSAADGASGAPPVALLGEQLWRTDFHADPQVLGKVIRIDGAWVTVVGVLPASFGFPGISRLWLPLHVAVGDHAPVWMVVRLRADTSLSAARQALDALNSRLDAQQPAGSERQRIVIKPLALGLVPENLRRWVWLMFGASALVLLLACVNVANLQLVQTLQRRRELALRGALGCSRARLMLGALLESLLLSLAALSLAVPIAHAGNRWLVTMYAANDQAPNAYQHFGIDGSVLAFAVLAAILSTTLAGMIPAWRASRADLQDALRDGSKGSGGGFARVVRMLVVAEVALTVVLLVGAGTFIRALDGLLAQPAAGATHAQDVLTAEVALPPALYMQDAQRIGFFETLVERLRQDPAVIAASASNTIPSAQLGSHEDVSALGQPRPTQGWAQAQMGIVDRYFLDAYAVRLTAGRFFDDRDNATGLFVVVIDRKMAEATWPGRDPLGQRLVLYPGNSWARTATVVGVIEPLQLDGALEESLPGVLMPLRQAAGQSPLHGIGIAVRTHAEAAAYTRRLIDIVRGVDTQAAVYYAYSQSRRMAMKRLGLMVLTEVFGALGLVALLLAAAGLYGVLAFSVAQRTREIGIRRAIGAGHMAILHDAGRQLLWQLGLGLGIGLALALPWSKLLADPNLHTRGFDPGVLVPVLLVVALIAVIASLVPLTRALRVDPVIALRHE
jgi:predicted permease